MFDTNSNSLQLPEIKLNGNFMETFKNIMGLLSFINAITYKKEFGHKNCAQ